MKPRHLAFLGICCIGIAVGLMDGLSDGFGTAGVALLFLSFLVWLFD